MSTTYDADPTATQAPADPPSAGTAPKSTLPADGDPANAASVAQLAKEPVDQIAFLKKPFANSAAFDQDIWAGAQDANLNGRWGVDHWGFPRASMIDWTEDWTPAAQFSGSAITAPKWTADCIGTASAIESWAPGSVVAGEGVPHQFRALAITVDGTTASNRSAIGREPTAATALFADDALAIMDLWVAPTSVLDVNWIIGFGCAGEAVNNFQNAVYFAPESGLPAGGHWTCCAISGGVLTRVVTTVLYDSSSHWLRIVWVGKNLDDGQVAARALFYVDGVRVANVVTNLPDNAGKLILPTAGGFLNTTVSSPVLLVGPLRYRQITALSTATV